jgi:endonuclease/exonuclease/phosphatase family metal-dependent hydrolase
MEPPPPHAVVAGCAVLTTFDDLAVTVANVHLAPGPGPDATSVRLEQLAAVVEASPTDALLVVGDTNTRLDETSAIADAGLLGDRPPQPTWNSRRNRFRADGHDHVAYYTRWFATDDLRVDQVEVWDEPIWSDGRTFHLSDHYALTLRVRRRA